MCIQLHLWTQVHKSQNSCVDVNLLFSSNFMVLSLKTDLTDIHNAKQIRYLIILGFFFHTKAPSKTINQIRQNDVNNVPQLYLCRRIFETDRQSYSISYPGNQYSYLKTERQRERGVKAKWKLCVCVILLYLLQASQNLTLIPLCRLLSCSTISDDV